MSPTLTTKNTSHHIYHSSDFSCPPTHPFLASTMLGFSFFLFLAPRRFRSSPLSPLQLSRCIDVTNVFLNNTRKTKIGDIEHVS